MRILIVESNLVLRNSLASLINGIKSCSLLGEVGNFPEAVPLLEKRVLNVIIADIADFQTGDLEGMNELLKRYPEIKMLILSNTCDCYSIGRAFRYGASGFLLKTPSTEELSNALNQINEDQIFISPSLLPNLVDNLVSNLPDHKKINNYKKLTKGEKENFRLIVRGLRRSEIAEKLFVSVKTVDHHKANIKRKLKVKNDLEMMGYATFIENGKLESYEIKSDGGSNILHLYSPQGEVPAAYRKKTHPDKLSSAAYL